MGEVVGLDAPPCRTVTAEEVDHLHEHGWVQLKRFVDPDVLARMLDLARERMGEDADSNPLPPAPRAGGRRRGQGPRLLQRPAAPGACATRSSGR